MSNPVRAPVPITYNSPVRSGSDVSVSNRSGSDMNTLTYIFQYGAGARDQNGRETVSWST